MNAPGPAPSRQCRAGVAALLILGASGCLTSRTFQPATTIGERQVAVDGEVAARLQFPGAFDHAPKIVATPVLGLTYGVTDRFDARLPLSGDLFGVQAKVALLQDRTAGGVTLSIAPEVAGLYYLIGYAYSWELPLLVGYRWSELTEWVVAATFKDARSTDPINGGILPLADLGGNRVVPPCPG
jgi:hypothetical protein